MGTNYYAKILPKEEEKQELIEAIKIDDFDKVVKLANELYGSGNEWDITEKGVFHLGKRSSGWDFLWNANLKEYCDSYMDGNYLVPVYENHKIYPLTKQGITDFVMREDVVVYDEYDEQQDKQEFLDMAFNWKGTNCKEYYSNPDNYSPYSNLMDERTMRMFRREGVDPEYHEFYNDGLRFSTSLIFS